jgi:hypothetical protein
LKTDINIDGMTRYIRSTKMFKIKICIYYFFLYTKVVLEKVLGTNKSHKRFNINVLRKVSYIDGMTRYIRYVYEFVYFS